jgi:hypothetical protein
MQPISRQHLIAGVATLLDAAPRIPNIGFGSETKLTKEIPRLCRGGSKRLTFPAVAPQASIGETSSVSRQAHEQSSIDGRPSMGKP